MKKEILQSKIARAVLRAPVMNPHKEIADEREVVFTIRPGWSKIAPYQTALPGGKIEKKDFRQLVSKKEMRDSRFTPPTEVLIAAALNAISREIYEELGWLGILLYVDVNTNAAGWTSYTFAADLEEKPKVVVQPDSAGTVWIAESKILNGHPKLLSGHLGMTRRAIRALDKKTKK